MNLSPLVFMTLLFAMGCGAPHPTTCTGGPVVGAADTHCGAGFVTVDKSACTPSGTMTAGDYGDALYGTSGYDDDCKYAVSYTVEPICNDEGVTFVVRATYAADGTPVAHAKVRLDAFLSDTHPAPNSGATTVEPTPGTYTIGPVKLDAAGQWTVRYHFFEGCADAVDSPHGHVAFFVSVP